MRIKNTIRNSLYAVGSYLSLAILALVIRKFFLDRLPTEYLGYEGLFTDIFAVLSIADLGLSSVISYRMYPALARNDEKTLCKLMAIYKMIYRFIGTGIGVVGLCLIPFLKFIIKDNQLNWNYVYIVYLLQLVTSLCGYFLAYKRVMLVVTQRESEITKVEWRCTIFSHILRIVVLLTLANYILYLLVSVLSNIVTNYIISKKVDRDYVYLSKQRAAITKEDIRELGIGKDIKNNIFQKICHAVYGGTDSILISSIIGISEVGLLSTYSLISNHVSNLFTKILNPFQAAISSFVHDESVQNKEEMFRMFDRLGFFIAAFVTTSYIVLFNPFIALVFGEKYLLPELFIFAFSLNQYIGYNHKFLCFYRGSFGKYEIDKFFTFSAAILNIVFSIILAKKIGIAGIFFGTVIGHMGFWIGRARVVYSEYLDEKVYRYIWRQIANIVICFLEIGATVYICQYFPYSFWGLCLRIGACLLIPNAINLLLFCRSDEFALMKEYFKKTRTTFLQLRNKERDK